MRWQLGRRSTNIEDRRGMGGGFGGRGMRMGGIGGIGGLIVVVIGLLFGVDLSFLVGGGAPVIEPRPAATRSAAPTDPREDQLKQFVSVVLADTEDTWKDLFARSGGRYQEPTLVLFSNAVRSACGFAEAATGPFYCPADQKVYLDLDFFDELDRRFGAPGDFAQAYVIAHEVGHHIQTLTGIARRVREAQAGADQRTGNRYQVMMELQADCLAGVWAHHAHRQRQILEKGDIEEGMRAASAVGDDRIQKRTRGYVVPDAFTHGSAEQRQRWFVTGLESGKFDACDTFSAGRL